ncbi:MAG: acetylxylan esterase [Planctomycetaceae bacterium]|nr:acetylxylan esterase [Planctomycetaceae bacterium]
MKHVLFLICTLFSFVLFAAETVAPPNDDESKVPKFELPDPLVMADGRKVDSVKMWTEQRRPELLKLFQEHVYGKPTLTEINMKAEIFETAPVFDGKGIRYQLQLVFFKGEQPLQNDPKVDFLIYTPARKNGNKKFPIFLGLNFMGNHTINADPEIRLAQTIWNRSNGQQLPAKDEERGKQSRRWQLETIFAHGFAVGTAYYGDFEPDFNGGIKHGVRRLIYKNGETPNPDDGNAIATWAWGLGKMLDAVTEFQDKLNIDPKKACLVGHSRLGKTSLWAGAIDERFSVVVSNDSGCGGSALSRREFGETVHRINNSFPHWFCGNFKKYNRNVNALPVDQHELVALIAPRPVYIASASEDLWADPQGEFLSAFYADPVYRLFETDGFGGVTEMPPVNQSVGNRIGYHRREGKHDIIEFDWIQFLKFAQKYL